MMRMGIQEINKEWGLPLRHDSVINNTAKHKLFTHCVDGRQLWKN